MYKCSTEVSYIMQSTKYNNKQAALARWRTASVTFDPSQIAHTPHCCTRNQHDLDRAEAVMIHTGTWARVMASRIGK